jgi:hypothetical protein
MGNFYVRMANMRRIPVLLVALTAMATEANADNNNNDIVSAVMYAGTNQSIAVCYLFNPTNYPIEIKKAEFLDQNGAEITVQSPNCTAPILAGNILPAGNTCGFGADVGAEVISCRITLNTDGAKVRGDFQLRQGDYVLSHMELR